MVEASLGRKLESIFGEDSGKAELLFVARGVLEKALANNLNIDETDLLFANAGITDHKMDFLEQGLPEFSGKNPLVLLREEIEKDRAEKTNNEVWHEVVTTPGLRLHGPAGYKAGKPRSYRHFKRIESNENFVFLRDPRELDRLQGDGITNIHLSGLEVANSETIRLLLERFPNLERISIPPSIYDQQIKYNSKIEAIIREAQNSGRVIELKRMRMRDEARYDLTLVDEEYRRRRGSYLKLTENPAVQQLMIVMDRYELDETEIARLYFTADLVTRNGKQYRLAVRDIANQLGMYLGRVNRKLIAFSALIGIDRSDYAQNHGLGLKNKIARLQKAEESPTARAEFRRQYKVGGVLPPEGLPHSRWETWQKVYMLTVDPINQEKLWRLQKDEPKAFLALVSFLTGSTNERGYFVLEEIGGFLGLTRERARQLKNKSLVFLGIEKD